MPKGRKVKAVIATMGMETKAARDGCGPKNGIDREFQEADVFGIVAEPGFSKNTKGRIIQGSSHVRSHLRRPQQSSASSPGVLINKTSAPAQTLGVGIAA